MNRLLTIASRCFYERTLDAFRVRLITINTKEKSLKFQSEITILKMMIVLISNLLESDND